MVFRGGCSLIFNLGDLNTVEYVILKNIKSYERFQRQAAYLNGEDPDGAAPSASLYAADDRDSRLRFNLLHARRTHERHRLRQDPHVSPARIGRLLSADVHRPAPRRAGC